MSEIQPTSSTSESQPEGSKDSDTTASQKDVLRRSLIGDVIRDKMEKTIVVEVSSLKTHPLYRKQYQRSTRYHVHDPNNSYKVGDRVEIMPMRPLSKTKRWYVLRKLS